MKILKSTRQLNQQSGNETIKLSRGCLCAVISTVKRNLNNISLVPHAIFFASLKMTNKDNF